MNNQQTMEYFTNLASGKVTANSTKINPFNDFSRYDAEFILKYARGLNVLDLASGTGITINKYSDEVHSVTAVEKFVAFSNLIDKKKNVRIVNEDIFEYEPYEKFEIITMFGIMHYVNAQEAEYLYTKYKKYLTSNGKLLIKQQFGVDKDILVSGYSAELKQNYYSEYRFLESEIKLLNKAGFTNIETIDIYPPEANRWNNTHFYALVCSAT